MKSNRATFEMTPSAAELDLAPLVRAMLDQLADDPHRAGLAATPARVDRALKYLTSGYRVDLGRMLNGALFEVNCDEMVVVRDIEFFSVCEHHLMPFFGKMHVAYLPRKKVVGLSKIPRIVDAFARRLQIQERLTQEVAQGIQECIDPLGVGVICEAHHFSMIMRGIEKQKSLAVTLAMLGAFRDSKSTRDEFQRLVDSRAPGV